MAHAVMVGVPLSRRLKARSEPDQKCGLASESGPLRAEPEMCFRASERSGLGGHEHRRAGDTPPARMFGQALRGNGASAYPLGLEGPSGVRLMNRPVQGVSE